MKKLKAANKEKAKAEIRAAEVPRVIESAPPANIKLSAFQEERQKYFFSKSKNLIIGKRQKLDQKETLEALARFKSALHSFEDNSTLPIRQKSFLKSQEFPVSSSERKNLDKANLEMDSSKQSCPLHNIVGCGSCKDMFIVSTTTSTEDSLIEKDPTWLAHRLNFVRQPGERDAKQDFAGLVVIDPRDRIQSFK